MIVAGILSIIFGIVLLLWVIMQRTSEIAHLSEAVTGKFASYYRDKCGIEERFNNASSEDYDHLQGIKNALGQKVETLDVMTDSLAKGFITVAVIAIVFGLLCVAGYFLFDKKRRNVQAETAKLRFEEKKLTIILGAVATVIGIVMCILAWKQFYSLSSLLERETATWDKKVDKLIKMEFANKNDTWLRVEPTEVMSDFGTSAGWNSSVVTALQVVGLLLIIAGSFAMVSGIGYVCKTKLFPVVNGLLLIIFAFIILFPLYKTLVDSFDATAGSGMYVFPQHFTTAAYKTIFSQEGMYRPFIISVIVTLSGTLLGLLLSTLGAYVLIQFEMPGRNFFANMLLFTMIFSGGMIPAYLLMSDLHLVDTLWAVILPLGIDVYNLVLMRNFFEGIPGSLFEAAEIDGCTPLQIFYKVVLPLSKAAIASIGLMFAVKFWNDYTNFKLYIPSKTKYQNFQMKLRGMIFGSETGNNSLEVYSVQTIQSAVVIIAVIPFMILYPFCQNYFVQGVNVGAVKE